MTPEGRVKAAIRKALLDRGFWQAGRQRPESVAGWFYMPVSNGMGVHGIPDFVCCLDGRMFVIEAKAPGKLGDLSENQKDRLQEIKTARGLTLVADNAAIVEEYLDEYGIRPDGGA